MAIYLLKIDFPFSVLFLPLLHLLVRRKGGLEVTHLMRNDMTTTPHTAGSLPRILHIASLFFKSTLSTF